MVDSWGDVESSWEDSDPQPPPSHKDIARDIYNQIKHEPEIQKELNKLLRTEKLKNIER